MSIYKKNNSEDIILDDVAEITIYGDLLFATVQY